MAERWDKIYEAQKHDGPRIKPIRHPNLANVSTLSIKSNAINLSRNDAPHSPTNAGSSSPNGVTEISDILSRLQLNTSQLQELFNALTDIVTKSAQPSLDNDTYNLINADDVPQNVSTEDSGDENADTAGRVLITATLSTVAVKPVVGPSPVASNRDSVAVSVVATAPPAVAPAGTTAVTASPVIVVPVAPVSIAAPAVASTTRMFNGVSYQYPPDDASGPFYLVTRGHNIGVFVGWENTSPLVTCVLASVSFHIPSAED
ncbi:uncharacterized protein LACBIDRAFT_312074 [Laccaria bicolor S238N-H82]|uniref:Predicted protein n=1 Tax=Laccaria bicolor (strain S238N-H82 / ATCC MYA-4686) TaxID=486041 RepID=B0CZ10_LACBS|nr:uncharacterized protein LACBIDRAFT_312074 [Laccaria bicolor S238N-H82]EDR12979.1 predicted protein [Laccaria bicolor S238N-H82]|eukprot:XP_001877243.1 predicted protein [Laccaria bicolor S238N-H82]